MAAASSSSLATRRLARRSAARSAAPERGTPTAAWPGRPRSCTNASGPTRTTSSARVGATASPAAAAARCAIAAGGGPACSRGPFLRLGSSRGPFLQWGAALVRRRPGDEADLRPRRQERGRGACGVPQHGVRPTDQLPAARRAAGVDPAELASEPDRPGRDARARLRPALDLQTGIAAGQVGEAGREAAEPDPPGRAGVRGHHLVDIQPGQLADLGQVRAVVDDGDLNGRALVPGDRRGVQSQDGASQRAEIGAWVDGHDHGPRTRHDVDHTRPVRCFDRFGVGEHGVEVGQLDEEGRVPHRPHPRADVCRAGPVVRWPRPLLIRRATRRRAHLRPFRPGRPGPALAIVRGACGLGPLG